MKTFWKTLRIFENHDWERSKVIFEKNFEIRNQKDLIENYFEKDVVKKIWLILKRCDWEDMIWKTFLKRFDFKNWWLGYQEKIWFKH